MQRSINDIALEKYGYPFHHLSAFGQREVLQVWNGQQEEITMEHVDMARALQNAQQRIATLERENLDLWEENEELQLRLMEKDEDSARRAGRRRQEGSRTRTDENTLSVSIAPTWQGERTSGEDSDQSS